MSQQIRVWDLPTRVFHWALVACIAGLVTTAQFGGDAMVWHFRLGYTVLSLLLFRLCWGLVGGHWSRFSSFPLSPRAMWRYISGPKRPADRLGHNPLGAASVYAMLFILLLQVSSGMFSDDEISAYGPLAQYVGSNVVGLATFYHKNVGKLILIALIVTHFGAIAFYAWRKNNLVKPMISGDTASVAGLPASVDTGRSRAIALMIFIGCSALVGTVISLTA